MEPRSVRSLINKGSYLEALKELDNSHLARYIEDTIRSEIFELLGRFDEAIKFAKVALTLAREKNDDEWIFRSLMAFGIGLFRIGEVEQAFNQFSDFKMILDDLKDEEPEKFKQLNPVFLNVQGLVFYYTGSYSQASSCFDQANKLFKINNNSIGEASALNNLGNSYTFQGKITEAIEILTQSLKVKKQFMNKSSLANTYHNLSTIYRIQGDYGKALDFANLAYEAHLLAENKRVKSTILQHLGLILHLFGDHQKAVDYLSQSLKVKNEIGNPYEIAEVNFHLYLVLSHQQSENRMVYLENLSEISKEASLISVSNLAAIAEGIEALRNRRLSTLVKAKEIFEKLYLQKSLKFDERIIVTLSLIEIAITEVEVMEEGELMGEVFVYIESLNEVTKTQGIISLEVELSVLKSKILFLQGKYTEAIDSLLEANKIATENDLIVLNEKIDSELATINKLYRKWGEIADKSSIGKQIEELEVKEYLEYLLSLSQIKDEFIN